jgi:hypothetical protein
MKESFVGVAGIESRPCGPINVSHPARVGEEFLEGDHVFDPMNRAFPRARLRAASSSRPRNTVSLQELTALNRARPRRGAEASRPMFRSPGPEPEPTFRLMTPSDAPCKRILAVLAAAPEWPPTLCAALEERFGPIDYRGPFLPFEDNRSAPEGGYYAAEMGAPLWRGWLSFRGTVAPAFLPEWTRRFRDLEAAWSRDGKRRFNLDPGYMDADKVVLASRKRGPFKIYLDEGVWADMVLGYSRGVFAPTPWAFPDFRDGRYDHGLAVIRERLKAEMRR